jgi:hypothetical protein
MLKKYSNILIFMPYLLVINYISILTLVFKLTHSFLSNNRYIIVYLAIF